MNWTEEKVGRGFVCGLLLGMMGCFFDDGCRRGGLWLLGGRSHSRTPIGLMRSCGSPALREIKCWELVTVEVEGAIKFTLCRLQS